MAQPFFRVGAIALGACLAIAAAFAAIPGEQPPERVDGPGAELEGPGDRLPGTEIMRADFETGDLSQWNDIQRVASDRITVVRDPVDQGRFAGRFEVRAGDNPVDGNDRAELRLATDEGEGDSRWYGWSTMFADDFPAGRGFQVVVQWRPVAVAGPASLAFYVIGDRLSLQANPHDAEDAPSGAPRTLWSAPLRRGSWRRFRMHVRWSGDDAAGAVDLWVDGRRVVRDARVRTLYPGERGQLKLGANREAGRPETGIVYHDAVRVSRG